MNIIDDLNKLSSAEEFFAYFDVDYDSSVLGVARLHIMRRMGEHIRALVSDEAGVANPWLECRAYLADAYNEFLHHAPIERRVFKVLKDAISPAKQGLVQLRASLGPFPNSTIRHGEEL